MRYDHTNNNIKLAYVLGQLDSVTLPKEGHSSVGIRAYVAAEAMVEFSSACGVTTHPLVIVDSETGQETTTLSFTAVWGELRDRLGRTRSAEEATRMADRLMRELIFGAPALEAITDLESEFDPSVDDTLIQLEAWENGEELQMDDVENPPFRDIATDGGVWVF